MYKLLWFNFVLPNVRVNGGDHVGTLVLFQYLTSTVLLNRTLQYQYLKTNSQVCDKACVCMDSLTLPVFRGRSDFLFRLSGSGLLPLFDICSYSPNEHGPSQDLGDSRPNVNRPVAPRTCPWLLEATSCSYFSNFFGLFSSYPALFLNHPISESDIYSAA